MAPDFCAQIARVGRVPRRTYAPLAPDLRRGPPEASVGPDRFGARKLLASLLRQHSGGSAAPRPSVVELARSAAVPVFHASVRLRLAPIGDARYPLSPAELLFYQCIGKAANAPKAEQLMVNMAKSHLLRHQMEVDRLEKLGAASQSGTL